MIMSDDKQKSSEKEIPRIKNRDFSFNNDDTAETENCGREQIKIDPVERARLVPPPPPPKK